MHAIRFPSGLKIGVPSPMSSYSGPSLTPAKTRNDLGPSRASYATWLLSGLKTGVP